MNRSFIFITFLSIIVVGCASLSVTQNEYDLVDLSYMTAKDASITKMIIFNSSSSFLYGVDGSGVIGITINDEGFTRLKIDEYVQLFVPKGNYIFDLEHIDILSFKSKQIIEAYQDSTISEIQATLTSNGAKIVTQ
jgi:hypothetical protein